MRECRTQWSADHRSADEHGPRAVEQTKNTLSRAERLIDPRASRCHPCSDEQARAIPLDVSPSLRRQSKQSKKPPGGRSRRCRRFVMRSRASFRPSRNERAVAPPIDPYARRFLIMRWV
jgi:hypothetical protein